MAEYRPAIHAYLTEEAHEAWQEFSRQGGCSVTAAIEDIGQDLKVRLEKGDVDNDDELRAWSRRARAIDSTRRRRSG